MIWILPTLTTSILRKLRNNIIVYMSHPQSYGALPYLQIRRSLKTVTVRFELLSWNKPRTKPQSSKGNLNLRGGWQRWTPAPNHPIWSQKIVLSASKHSQDMCMQMLQRLARIHGDDPFLHLPDAFNYVYFCEGPLPPNLPPPTAPAAFQFQMQVRGWGSNESAFSWRTRMLNAVLRFVKNKGHSDFLCLFWEIQHLGQKQICLQIGCAFFCFLWRELLTKITG